MVREFLFWASPKKMWERKTEFGLENVWNSALPTLSEFGVWAGKGMEFSVANPISTRCLGWQRYPHAPWQNEFSQFPRVNVHC